MPRSDKRGPQEHLGSILLALQIALLLNKFASCKNKNCPNLFIYLFLFFLYLTLQVFEFNKLINFTGQHWFSKDPYYRTVQGIAQIGVMKNGQVDLKT